MSYIQSLIALIGHFVSKLNTSCKKRLWFLRQTLYISYQSAPCLAATSSDSRLYCLNTYRSSLISVDSWRRRSISSSSDC